MMETARSISVDSFCDWWVSPKIDTSPKSRFDETAHHNPPTAHGCGSSIGSNGGCVYDRLVTARHIFSRATA